jgi:hypothetical protein
LVPGTVSWPEGLIRGRVSGSQEKWPASASENARKERRKAVSIDGSSAGATFYYLSGAFVKKFQKMGVKDTIEVTGGPIHNNNLS